MLVPIRSFQPSLMFEDKARSLPKSDGPEKSSTEIGSDLTGKH